MDIKYILIGQYDLWMTKRCSHTTSIVIKLLHYYNRVSTWIVITARKCNKLISWVKSASYRIFKHLCLQNIVYTCIWKCIFIRLYDLWMTKNVFSCKLNCNKVITLLQLLVDLNCKNARKFNKLISWFKIASGRIFKHRLLSNIMHTCI